jgi:hypothetical protein
MMVEVTVPSDWIFLNMFFLWLNRPRLGRKKLDLKKLSSDINVLLKFVCDGRRLMFSLTSF